MGIVYEGSTEQVRQIVHHHAVLRRGLERRAGTVCDAVASGAPCQRQVAILRGYLDEEILPHARAEERTLGRAAAAQARDSELVRALIMAVVVVASLAAWLTLVLLADRDPRGRSAAADAGRRDEETGATVTQLPSGDKPSGKAAA